MRSGWRGGCGHDLCGQLLLASQMLVSLMRACRNQHRGVGSTHTVAGAIQAWHLNRAGMTPQQGRQRLLAALLPASVSEAHILLPCPHPCHPQASLP